MNEDEQHDQNAGPPQPGPRPGPEVEAEGEGPEVPAEPGRPGDGEEEGETEAARREAGLNAELAELRAENAAQLAAYCELARALPGLVPELVGGTSLEAVRGSVTAAREAYSRIAASLAPPEGGFPNPGPFTGAGGGTRSGPAAGEDSPVGARTGRGVDLIYQALAGSKNGNLAR